MFLFYSLYDWTISFASNNLTEPFYCPIHTNPSGYVSFSVPKLDHVIAEIGQSNPLSPIKTGDGLFCIISSEKIYKRGECANVPVEYKQWFFY